MIYLKSGRPGSGKTLAAIQQGLAWVKEGRKVYELGINGCDHAATGFLTYPGDLQDWAEILKPGDVLIVDEIQRFIPKMLTRDAVPRWIEELTRNRHYGIDMLWTTQRPKNVDSFVRGLVNRHDHYVNMWGKPKAKVYTWPDGVDEPDSKTLQKVADSTKWDYPKELFPLYTSAQAHTRKAYTPAKLKWLYVAAAGFVVLVFLSVWAVSRLMPKKPDARGTSAPASVLGSPGGAGVFSGLVGDARRPALTPKEFLHQLEPLIPSMPWSAPIFAERKAESQPELYCVSMLNQDSTPGRCRCLTEQGTTVRIDLTTCRDIALNGLYNPFRRPLQDMVRGRDDRMERPQPETVSHVESDRATVGQVAGKRGPDQLGHRPLSEPYHAEVFMPATSQY